MILSRFVAARAGYACGLSVLLLLFGSREQIAEVFGVKGSYVFSKMNTHFSSGSHSLLSLRDFIDLSYQRYASAPVALFEKETIAKVRSNLMALPFA